MSDIKIVLPINEKEYIRDCQLMYDKGRADERKRIVTELEEEKIISGIDLNYLDYIDGINKAIELVRGDANETEI